uniref:Protein zer-1 homolog-like C-terminal domain-containing protein n=1 Tax=Dendroctonus ponderosae TaxID=77166 RepID=A0AAR5QJW0_DENPD
MYQSPISLEEICLNVACSNILLFVEPEIRTKDGWRTDTEGSDCYDEEKIDKRYQFRDPDMFLINKVSEELLNKMMERKVLCDATLNIFNSRNTCLRKVSIKNCKVSKCGLEILKQHRITELEIGNLLDVGIGDVLACLNDWSLQNITTANFADCQSPTGIIRIDSITNRSGLSRLRHLNVSNTELDQNTFKILCREWKLIETLNLSNTFIEDLYPLRRLRHTLTSLCLTDVTRSDHFRANNLAALLDTLTSLRVLDMSLVNKKPEIGIHRVGNLIVMRNSDPETIFAFLKRSYCLPNLKCFDISGWKDYVSTSLLVQFVSCHQLNFLGLVLCSAASHPDFSPENCRKSFGNMRVAGLANTEQIEVTLHYYTNRSNYVQKAMYYLFQDSDFFSIPRPDIFNLIVDRMEAHLGIFGVQMAATACLYNLTRAELCKHIHPHDLRRMVKLVLLAMEKFPDEFQLQKNSLLTLCSDRILQDVTFERARCARLVLGTLCGFEDVNMNRMAVAICSILASKLTTAETSELGSNPIHMRKMLSLIVRRVDTGISDMTLTFTLSALWNLTDESIGPCEVFLEQGGHLLYVKVLLLFKGNTQLETKVLGLLNNIAEVIHLRHRLLSNDFVLVLLDVLQSESIDVSFFAAGILAHLTSDGDEAWKSIPFSRTDILNLLYPVVRSWPIPNNEMVTYRSFKPFFPLLSTDKDYQGQYWAVWAIHHVCVKNPNRYCQMLYNEHGHTLLNDLINFENVRPRIRRKSNKILDILRHHGISI